MLGYFRDSRFQLPAVQSGVGLFTQPDSLLPNVYDPQQLNRYAFERGNPYNRVDPDGHIAPIVGIFLIGAGIGFVSEAIVQIHNKDFNPGRLALKTVTGGGVALLVATGASIVTAGVLGTGAAGAVGIGVEVLLATKDLTDLSQTATELSTETSTDSVLILDEDEEPPQILDEDLKKIKPPLSTTLTNAQLGLPHWTPSTLSGSQSTSGWTEVLDDEGNVDYYCSGTGCPQ